MREHGQSDVDCVLLSVGCLLSEHFPLGLGLSELVANPTTVPRVLGIGHVPAFVAVFGFFFFFFLQML